MEKIKFRYYLFISLLIFPSIDLPVSVFTRSLTDLSKHLSLYLYVVDLAVCRSACLPTSFYLSTRLTFYISVYLPVFSRG